MVTDAQFRRLMRLLKTEKTLATAAAKAGMDDKTARKYRHAGRPPSELATPHAWRTRPDPFADVWPRVKAYLEDNAGLEAKTLFDWLQREYPGRFPDGQLRTFQRRVKAWRAVEGPAREVMFPQIHEPGRLAQSDFTHMDKLGVRIAGQPFPHLIYHFVLTWSNWETGTICFSESFESLSAGLQRALWELGGAVRVHQTDSLTSAVNKLDHREEFTDRYRALLAHYGMEAIHSQPATPHENGDIEQRHHRFKRALEQRLILRGSRDFASRPDYEAFLRRLLAELNAGRADRVRREMAHLHRLPARRLDAGGRIQVRVGPHSTIRVRGNIYSVHSRLIGEQVWVRLLPEQLEVWYGGQRVEVLPRLVGKGKHHINYRHIIDWLVRKPGAFARYRYHDELFPTSRFRLAWDSLRRADPLRGHKQYLAILHLAATENETAVDECLRRMIDQGEPITADGVQAVVRAQPDLCPPRDARVDPVDLHQYDQLCADWIVDEPATMEALACR
jgi:hypothetical protein